MIDRIKFCLENEKGAAGIEELIGISCALSAGIAVYIIANKVRTEIKGVTKEVKNPSKFLN